MIQAVCNPQIARWFRSLLKPGEIIKIGNYILQDNLRTYRYTTCQWSIKMTDTIMIRKYDGPPIAIPICSYDFLPFEMLAQRALQNVHMTGKLHLNFHLQCLQFSEVDILLYRFIEFIFLQMQLGCSLQ